MLSSFGNYIRSCTGITSSQYKYNVKEDVEIGENELYGNNEEEEEDEDERNNGFIKSDKINFQENFEFDKIQKNQKLKELEINERQKRVDGLFAFRKGVRDVEQRFQRRLDRYTRGTGTGIEESSSSGVVISYTPDNLVFACKTGDVNAVIDILDHTGDTCTPSDVSMDGDNAIFASLMKYLGFIHIEDFNDLNKLRVEILELHKRKYKKKLKKVCLYGDNVDLEMFEVLNIDHDGEELEEVIGKKEKDVDFLQITESNINTSFGNGYFSSMLFSIFTKKSEFIQRLNDSESIRNLDIVLEILICKGGDIDYIRYLKGDVDGCAVIHEAAMRGCVGMMQWLIKHGSDVDIVTKNLLKSPLMIAVEKNHMDVVLLLLHTKAIYRINSIDSKGWTALHYAAAYGSVDLNRVLLYCGAKINIRNKSGRTPKEEAQAKGNVANLEVIMTFKDPYVEGKRRMDFQMFYNEKIQKLKNS